MSLSKPMDRAPLDPMSCLTGDPQMQVSVLSVLLAAHPAQLTVSELAHELVDDLDDLRQRLAVKQAVRDLAGVGLLRRDGIFVLPGRVAVDDERLGAVA